MYVQYTFNVHSMFSYVIIVCLSGYSLTYLLTHLLSYPKSRDAIASKNIYTEVCIN